MPLKVFDPADAPRFDQRELRGMMRTTDFRVGEKRRLRTRIIRG